MTILMSTRHADPAMGMADILAVLHDGRLIDLDRPQTLYTSPRSALTARLTGPVNLVPQDLLLAIPSQNRTDIVDQVIQSGPEWALVLRPDHLTISLTAPAPGIASLEGHIQRVTYSTSGLTAQIGLPGWNEGLVARVDGARLGADDLLEGRRVWCTWEDKAARAVHYDKNRTNQPN